MCIKIDYFKNYPFSKFRLRQGFLSFSSDPVVVAEIGIRKDERWFEEFLFFLEFLI